jgi:hypothetical protein
MLQLVSIIIPFLYKVLLAPGSIEEAAGGDGFLNVVWDEALIAAQATGIVAGLNGKAPAMPPAAASPVDPAPPPAAAPGPMRWTNTSSGFVLRRMA